jgi:hypothetical protein
VNSMAYQESLKWRDNLWQQTHVHHLRIVKNK